MENKKKKKIKKILKKLEPVFFLVIFIIFISIPIFIVFFVIIKLWIPLIFENLIILLQIRIGNYLDKYSIVIATCLAFCIIQVIRLLLNKFFRKNNEITLKKPHNKIITIGVVSFVLIGELICINKEVHIKADELPDLEKIENYIVECSSREMTYNHLKELDGMELYYIRNGIYAYCGVKFESGFYDSFDWYNGSIEEKDFEWDMLNHYQQLNINTILRIEEENRNN